MSKTKKVELHDGTIIEVGDFWINATDSDKKEALRQIRNNYIILGGELYVKLEEDKDET